MDLHIKPKRGSTHPQRGNRLTKALADGALRLSGWRLVGEIPNVPKLIVIGAPHESSWDFFLAVMAIFSLGIRASWMAKKSIFRPPLGGIMRWLGGIPIDRSASFGVVEQTVAEFDRRPQLVLGLAPEGTRTRGLPWKTGFYRIAHAAHVPIVMAYIDNPGKTLYFGPAFQTTDDFDKDMAAIMAFYADPYGERG